MAEIVPGEVKPVEPVVEDRVEEQEPEYTETEIQAMNQGWQPKDKWDGNPDDHRSAKEFLDRGELLTKIKSQSQELREVQRIVGVLSEHNKGVYVAGYQAAIKALQKQKFDALENRDNAKVVQIDEQLDQTKRMLATVAATPAVPQGQQATETPAFGTFKARNLWYTRESAMRNWAHGAALEFAQANKQASESDVYQYLENEVRREFPHKFGRQGPPSPDGDGRQASSSGTGGKGSNSFEKLLSRLPEDLAKTARDMVKRGIVTKEKYIEDYQRLEDNR